MKGIEIDINCDVGEGLGNEKYLMPFISSCNIACGGHAGDKETMAEVADLAKGHGVRVGAHPSYPDPGNFGRVSMDIDRADLVASLQRQMDGFRSILKESNVPLNHIKAHGALYNDISKNIDLAKAFLDGIEEYRDSAAVFVPFGSAIEEAALRRRFMVIREAFADRNYNFDLSLVSRKQRNAVISDPEKVLRHMLRMIKEDYVLILTGKKIYIRAETFCVHSDTPSVLEILAYLSEKLPQFDIHIKK